jgi:hypothetical protein
MSICIAAYRKIGFLEVNGLGSGDYRTLLPALMTSKQDNPRNLINQACHDGSAGAIQLLQANWAQNPTY